MIILSYLPLSLIPDLSAMPIQHPNDLSSIATLTSPSRGLNHFMPSKPTENIALA